MSDQSNLPGLKRCATCGTADGLHRFERVSGGGWACIPCVREAQGLLADQGVASRMADAAYAVVRDERDALAIENARLRQELEASRRRQSDETGSR